MCPAAFEHTVPNQLLSCQRGKETARDATTHSQGSPEARPPALGVRLLSARWRRRRMASSKGSRPAGAAPEGAAHGATATGTDADREGDGEAAASAGDAHAEGSGLQLVYTDRRLSMVLNEAEDVLRQGV